MKKKQMPLIPARYVVILYNDGEILSSGNSKTKHELKEMGIHHEEVIIDDDRYFVEEVKYLEDIDLHVVYVTYNDNFSLTSL